MPKKLLFIISIAGASFIAISAAPDKIEKEYKNLKGELAWEKLSLGNALFLENTYPNLSPKLEKHQDPYAIVLSCSDSRVGPEIIFNEKLGKIFIIRTAGHVVDDAVIASIEYAVTKLKAPLLVIMGHENCGAVNAALKDLKANKGKIKTEATTYIDHLIIPIERAIKASKVDITKPSAENKAIVANVKYVAEELLYKSTKVYDAVNSNKLKLVGAEFRTSGEIKRIF